MQISEIMHKGVSIVTINDSVRKVAELMRQKDIGAVPVMENNKPVGFVTDRDIVINCVAEGYNMDQPVRHAMSEDVICVKEHQDVEDATKLMKDKQVSRILVVDESEKPIGMVSLQDISQSRVMLENTDTISKIKQ
jgi:CBS domain-containing protein